MEHSLPDLVFMDLMMPVMNGDEAVKAIRTRNEWNHVPVVILTAKAREEIFADPIHGATAYLSKPIEVRKLMELMAELLPMQEFACD
jgi:CheY-like chemotaxis protein